jgi:hypothetical protein
VEKHSASGLCVRITSVSNSEIGASRGQRLAIIGQSMTAHPISRRENAAEVNEAFRQKQ